MGREAHVPARDLELFIVVSKSLESSLLITGEKNPGLEPRETGPMGAIAI